jgi:flagellar hook-associated protein 3 FlgL
MSITPVQVPRVSLQLQTQRLLQAIRTSRYTSYYEQSRLASGRNFLVPSDDPVAAARSLQLSELLDQQNQLSTNTTQASTVLDATDSALGDLNDLLNQAHTIASQNVGSLTNSDERTAAAELIASIREQFVLVGNRQLNGRYLFAGRDTTSQPFQSTLGGVAYLGDTGDVLTRVAENEFEAVNVTGAALFGALSARVSGSVDLNPAVTAATRLDDVAGAQGEGVRRGVLVFNETSGVGEVRVDLNTADTLGDVVDLINAAATAAGAGFSASVTTTGLTITPAGELLITDTGGGGLAGDLGIYANPPATAPVVGADLGARLTRTTLVEDLADGAGLDLTDPIRITNGSQSKSLDLSAAVTVQDILNTINGAGLGVRAEINATATGIDVVNLVSGTQMNIAEDGGTTAATLGIRSLDLTTPLSALNRGAPFATAAGEDDIRIVAKDGSTVDVDLDGAVTLGDVIDRINEAAIAAGVPLLAGLTASGDGWQIADETGGTGTLNVFPLNDTVDAAALGLNRSADPSADALVINDLSTADGDDVLATLFDLEQALRDDDTSAITAAGERLTGVTEDVTRLRGVIGARAQGMQERQVQMENASSATQIYLSQVQDLDYAEAATHFEQAQTALQASLMTSSKVMGVSLLDYLTV